MYADIASAASFVKTASELATLLINTKVNTKVTQAVREKAIELQSVIISLQSTILAIQAQYQDVLTEKDRLKQELVNAKNWEAEAAKHELKEIALGVFVYVIKEDQRGTQPVYWLCANCYENNQKSILQKGSKETSAGHPFYCPSCKTTITCNPKVPPYM